MREPPPAFHVDLIFPDDHSDFVAEIYYRDKLVCIISQEKGLENAEIEFEKDVRGFPGRMSLRNFEQAISYSIKRLHELRKVN